MRYYDENGKEIAYAEAIDCAMRLKMCDNVMCKLRGMTEEEAMRRTCSMLDSLRLRDETRAHEWMCWIESGVGRNAEYVCCCVPKRMIKNEKSCKNR